MKQKSLFKNPAEKKKEPPLGKFKEKDFQRIFSRWVKNNAKYVGDNFGGIGGNCVFELKMAKTKSIRFDVVAEHQMQALMGANGRDIPCYHKINDMPFIKDNPRSRFTNPKPFDCFFLSDVSAKVVVFFYKAGQKRAEREMIVIDVYDWLNKAEMSSKKSMTEMEAREIGRAVKFDDGEK